MNYEAQQSITRSDQSFWSAIKEAVRGSHQDYTEAPVSRAVLLLAVPMVLETLMESIFAVVDIFWVSHLGSAAMAAVGLTEAMLTLLYAIAIGLTMGATATVARRIGEKKPEEASLSAVQSIAIGIVVSVPLALIGGLYAPQLLSLMGASSEVIAIGSGFTRVMFAGNASILLLFLINAVFRGAGDAAMAMRVLWLANWINILLGPCFIFGLGPFPELGVTGAAVATTIGRSTGVIYQIYRLLFGQGRIRIRVRHIRIDLPIIRNIFRISVIGVFQALVSMTSWLGLIRILAGFGSNAVAGYTVGMRIIAFAILPSWGLSNAAATLVGQNLGAGRPQRAEQSVWITCRHNLVFLGSIGLIFLIFAKAIISIFTRDPAVVPFAVQCLKIVSCGFVFYAFGMVVTQAFNGAGDTWTPTIINLFCFWLWEIPLGYFLAKRTALGPSGVFIAVTVAFSTLAVVSVLVFRTGRWKRGKA